VIFTDNCSMDSGLYVVFNYLCHFSLLLSWIIDSLLYNKNHPSGNWTGVTNMQKLGNGTGVTTHQHTCGNKNGN
jgi:hypothetical protein